MATKNHVSLVGTASGTVQSATLNAKSIAWISNDGANSITFNFDETVTTSGAFLVPAGATTPALDLSCTTIYYIATSGDTSFSILGYAW